MPGIDMDPTLPTQNLPSLERLKFSTDSSGSVIIRTSGSGTFRIVGLNTDQKTFIFKADDTARQIPNLTGANTISLHNRSTLESVFIGKSTVVYNDGSALAAGGETECGWELSPGEKVDVDVSATIPIYVICKPAKTVILGCWAVA